MARVHEDADLVTAAARNNAELCDAVCHARGLDGVFAAHAWSSRRRTPEYYSDAVTLAPAVMPADVLAGIDGSPGASVKDSFADLGLRADGFRILFSAEWIWRPVAVAGEGGSAVELPAVEWSAVVDAAGLRSWEAAWSADGTASGRFGPDLLRAPDLLVLRAERDGAIVAGAIVNRTGDVVGVSNLFSTTGDLSAAWTGCLAHVAARFPGVGVVGYEAGAMLEAARAVGFRTIGPLRVWIKD